MSKPLYFMPQAWEEYLSWQTQDKKTLRRINQLLRDAQRNAFEGVGKPEPLRGDLSGYWSRRIDAANRLVYTVEDNMIVILSCRSHYSR